MKWVVIWNKPSERWEKKFFLAHFIHIFKILSDWNLINWFVISNACNRGRKVYVLLEFACATYVSARGIQRKTLRSSKVVLILVSISLVSMAIRYLDIMFSECGRSPLILISCSPWISSAMNGMLSLASFLKKQPYILVNLLKLH